MTVVIHKKATRKQISAAKRKLIKQQTTKSGLALYFGALKRGIDGITYQKEARNEWR